MSDLLSDVCRREGMSMRRDGNRWYAEAIHGTARLCLYAPSDLDSAEGWSYQVTNWLDGTVLAEGGGTLQECWVALELAAEVRRKARRKATP